MFIPVTMPGYVCTLSDRDLKKAKDELHEDPKERESQIEAFRKWIKQQPHLKCPTGKSVYPPHNLYTHIHEIWFSIHIESQNGTLSNTRETHIACMI